MSVEEEVFEEVQNAGQMIPNVIVTGETLRVLYIFAGIQRKADIEDCLCQFSQEFHFQLVMCCVDLLRSQDQDILQNDNWELLHARIQAREFDFVLITPPCSTFSRARHSGAPGPPAVRSRLYPLGYPWLFGRHKRQVETANLFIDIMCQGFTSASAAGVFWLGEHPEDLGMGANGEVPASIWSLPEVIGLPDIHTAAIFQCPFGAISSKPTRLISNWELQEPITMEEGAPTAGVFRGWPKFDKKFRYMRPLPRSCGHLHPPLLGKSERGEFRTAAAAAYPPKMCFWLAKQIFLRWQASLSPPLFPTEGALSEQKEDSNTRDSLTRDSLLKPEPQIPKSKHVLRTVWAGKERDFHDGLNLNSPGRIYPEHRPTGKWERLEELKKEWTRILREQFPNLDALCYRLATGKFSENPFSAEIVQKARDVWFKMLSEESELPLEKIAERTDHQTFYLFALGETLRLIGDVDHEIFWRAKDSFVSGVPVGYKEIIPLIPDMYEEKQKWRKYDETLEVEGKDNYVSATEEILRKQFAEEEELGHMFTIEYGQAKRRWKEVRISAQAAIEKSDSTFRIVHDGTHGVNVNNHIKMVNLQRFPTAAEQRALMTESSELRPGVHFCLQADVSKAHRRFLHKESDLGLLCCRADSKTLTDNSILHVNRVGTFGIVSASFWWGRLCSAIGRLVLTVMGRQWFWILMFADDSRTQAHGPEKFTMLALSLFIWVIVGTPFSWKKVKGGLALDWLGYWVDYGRFQLGISEARTQWLIKWGKKILSDKLVLVAAMTEGLGRLSFTTGVLEFYKPFLAPMFAWCAAAPQGAVLPVPPLILFTLDWIVNQLSTGRNVTTHKGRRRITGEIFRTDAKAEVDYVVIGGWESRGGVDPKQARWFSLRIGKEQAPWLFERGHGSRTVASSELLGTLAAVHLFVEPNPDREVVVGDQVATVIEGVTDNQSNSYVIKRLLSTKLPLAAVLMELATCLAEKGLWLNLTWTRREDNQLADDLTNEEFHKFDLAKRVELRFEDLPSKILDRVNTLATQFVEELDNRKKSRDPQPVSHRKKRRRVKEAWG